MMRALGILLAAGESRRMGFDKLTTPIAGNETAVTLSAGALILGGCECLIIPSSGPSRAYAEMLRLPVPIHVIDGGATRQESVKNALEKAEALMGGEPAIAVIHDAARCFVSPAVVRFSIESAERTGSGVAATAMTDTVLLRDGEQLTVLNRENLLKMQTPQTFQLARILDCYRRFADAATDDCSLYVRGGYAPTFIEGGADNFKLTTKADWEAAKMKLNAPCRMGTGFDTHVFDKGRKLILGGVEIPYERGLLGHSDADVLIHAIIDALLGAAALGDIGKLFPDTDDAYLDIDSRVLLKRTREALTAAGFSIVNVDATVIAQQPKLRPYIDAMRQNIADTLELPLSAVSVKATTTERMNDEGRGLCMSAEAAAVIR